MFKKKEKVQVLIEDQDEDFVIYQVYRPLEHIKKSVEYKPSKVASPIMGSQVPDKRKFIDNGGDRDIDLQYDFIRRDEDKHLTKEDVIERKGSEFYEFDILDNNKAQEIQGSDTTNKFDAKEEEIDYKAIQEEKNKIEKSKKESSLFVGLVDTIDDLEEEEKSYDEENSEFEVDLEPDESDNIEYNQVSDTMPEVKPVSIPSFLNNKPKENTYIKTEDLNLNTVDFDSKEFTSDLEFNNIPDMSAPKIKYEETEEKTDDYYNPGVDKNLTIEELQALSHDGTTVPVKEEEAPITKEPVKEERKEIAPKDANPYKGYKVPYKDLFPKSDPSKVDSHPAWLEEKKNIINDTLKSFNIDGEVVNYTKGPAFTQYEIMLAPGVNVKKVNQIYDNLQMNLQVKSIRVLAPIPGRNTVGIEAPNDKADVVAFGDIIDDNFINDGKPLNVALGKMIDGSPIYQNITSMPHCLIAGATQSGKSVCINTILVSLITKNSPENLKLILVDPKKVELSFYNDLPHLATPVIDDPEEATEALKWACIEMDRRYDVLSRNRVRNIGDYNKKREQYPTLEAMPYIVIVVDEFNDLVMQCGQEVNDCIIRLAQKARAAGMHILLATQRPTVDVVNGTIKANVTCRIAFHVASATDSTTILDEVGAENLLGRGDMIIKNNSDPVRAQGAYISDEEIGAVCDYICQRYSPDYIFTHEELRQSIKKAQNSSQTGSGKGASAEDDELVFSVAEFCIEENACSINAIQNRFSLGYNRAARIVALLEEKGIVSKKQGTKAREILVDDYKLREILGIED